MFKYLLPFAFLALISGPAFAKNGSDDSNRNDDRGGRSDDSNSDDSKVRPCKARRVRTDRYRFESVAGFETTRARLEVRSGRCNGKRSIERLTAKVDIPIPTAALGVTDVTTASTASVRYIFSRDGVDYASCVLRFDADDDDLEDSVRPRSSYKFDVESRIKKGKSSTRSKKGRCDIDLVADGVQSGLPAVQDEDLVRAEVLVAGSPVKFAEDAL